MHRLFFFLLTLPLAAQMSYNLNAYGQGTSNCTGQGDNSNFNSWNTAANSWQASNIATTTATTGSGSYVMTVASATGIVSGRTW